MKLTITDFRKAIGEDYNDVNFVYKGKPSGVSSTVHEYIPSFHAWYGDKEKEYKSVDELMGDKFFGGKSLSELIGHVVFEFD